MHYVSEIDAIGLIIAAYIVFRSIESLLHMGKGGTHNDLFLPSQIIIGLLAIAALAVAVVFGLALLDVHVLPNLTGGPSAEDIMGMPPFPPRVPPPGGARKIERNGATIRAAGDRHQDGGSGTSPRWPGIYGVRRMGYAIPLGPK